MPSTLYEPKEALERGTGYVGSAKPGDSLYFPHVDSCCALALVLDGNWVLGGHVPQVWDKNSKGIDVAANMKKITDLMDVTRRNRVENKEVKGIIAVGPDHWSKPYETVLATYDPTFLGEFPALRVDTSNAAQGVNVTITGAAQGVQIQVEDYQTHRSQTYKMPAGLKDTLF